MADVKKHGGRPRTGSLEMKGKTWHARLTITVEGESVRRWFDLGTDWKPLAQRKLARLLKEQAKAEKPSPEALAEAAKRPETTAEAIERITKRQGDEGLKTWEERRSRLRRYAVPLIGERPVTEVRPMHVREVLEKAGEEGLAKQSVTHLRNDLSTVFGDLWRDEEITENPVKRVKLPKALKVDGRPRVVLTDQQFDRFMSCADVPEHLHLMALCSRSFGGMRTSDLHAWDWSHVDVDGWTKAEVYRPKTDGPEAPAELETLALPELVRAPLEAWWTRAGKKRSGPVFPVRKGERAGERHGKRSYARELRYYLWRAGVHLPQEGFAPAMAKLEEASAGWPPCVRRTNAAR